MGEDAVEEFEVSHMKKEIDAIRAKDISLGGLTQGQRTQIARNEQRMPQCKPILDKAMRNAYKCRFCIRSTEGFSKVEKVAEHYEFQHKELYKSGKSCSRCGNFFVDSQELSVHPCPIPALSKRELDAYFLRVHRAGGSRESSESGAGVSRESSESCAGVSRESEYGDK